MSTYTYKNARAALTGSYATVYTCPASTTAIVLSAHAANIDGAADVTVSLQWLDSSAANAATRLGEPITVTVNSSYEALEAPKVLEAGDAFQAKAGDVSDIELTLAIVEIS